MSKCEVKETVGTVYLQKERHFKKENINEYSRKLFTIHLIRFKIGLRSKFYEVIVSADINENIIDGKLAKALR